jgi:hypothetical protein
VFYQHAKFELMPYIQSCNKTTNLTNLRYRNFALFTTIDVRFYYFYTNPNIRDFELKICMSVEHNIVKGI